MARILEQIAERRGARHGGDEGYEKEDRGLA